MNLRDILQNPDEHVRFVAYLDKLLRPLLGRDRAGTCLIRATDPPGPAA
ncbi:hypothetical protein [Kitasatospora kifunensis]|uniref:Uncharacterized protein n=1 Tax=Kitasatospora kifunensis TaxID=58351 RepID=A0A7W7VZE6_KITKI|nr:hypothetical protein [Kitasatospora kifunensis]MBB4928486.1 hypothetical protein [Kitasatospora kifunensis]